MRRDGLNVRTEAILLVLLLAGTTLAGCVAPTTLGPSCDAQALVERGTRFLDSMRSADGGTPAYRGGVDDPRLAAWALIAAGLARRAGYEDAYDARPAVAWLESRLPAMFQEGTGVDSIANNVSLARTALQVWGRSAALVSVSDPEHPDAATLKGAWDARYDAESGRYGVRLNEHLFAGFAARLFEADAPRLAAMAAALHSPQAWTGNGTHDPFTGDVWFAAYARALLGPEPGSKELAERFDGVIASRVEGSGGARSIPEAAGPDASSTAAVLLAWGEQGDDLDSARVQAAIGYLCSIVRENGSIPFRSDLHVLVVKTTAEVVIALSLLLAPIPWPEAPRSG